MRIMQENKVKKSTTAQARCDGEELAAWLNSVPHGDYKRVLISILEGCMIPVTTLNNWRQGKCRIPKLHKMKINEIAQKQVFK